MIDYVVIGQGLAGTALTWSLLQRGATVQVIDRDDQVTASRIAAGLITPISGKRFTLAAAFDRLSDCAHRHYRAVSDMTGTPILAARPAIRLAESDADIDLLTLRCAQLGDHITDIAPIDGLKTAWRGFQMPHAARLNVADYLDSSRREFRNRGIFTRASVACARIEASADHVKLHELGLSARCVIFCGGYGDQDNPWLPDAAFNAAKGEILTVQIAGFAEQRTVHAANCWLVPTATSGVYRCGATYDHDDLSTDITIAARETLLRRLTSFVALPVTVLEQNAAIRPIGKGRKPIVGRHEHYPVAWLNGLGSKGALWAPSLASALADHLLDGTPIVDVTGVG